MQRDLDADKRPCFLQHMPRGAVAKLSPVSPVATSSAATRNVFSTFATKLWRYGNACSDTPDGVSYGVTALWSHVCVVVVEDPPG